MFAYWSYLLLFTFFSIFVIIYFNVALDFGKLFASVQEYRICVLIQGDDEDCSIENTPPYWILLVLNILGYVLPIITFLTFGARKELLLFWKEYFVFMWKEKKLVLGFIPSFDPTLSPTISTSSEEPNLMEKLRDRVKEIY